ncbi:centrosomal protein of 63 kDa isoform X4 [Eublepharis macularius]|uniref:Centrosomal protein of 63 kDa isoform X4 n=1 Tax=Eublepharis macularius TaxID=481883 RepID=A0AA97JJF9_EUBMA|nr:centrosomal protein of 63 kDa isoform X4 [Eublepharis macularius]
MEALLQRMQRQGQSGGFLTSCEAELQELMKQIDIMVAHKRTEWESQTQTLESCLEIREQELSSLQNVLDAKHKEIARLCQRLEEMEQLNQDMTMEYEQQLKKVQEELIRLKRSYEKLQKKQLKEVRQASKSLGEDSEKSEVGILTRKLEEFRQKSLDWEKQRLHYQQHVASLETQRKALAEQSELIQSQLCNRKQMFESVELASQSEIQHLTSKLERANDTICANELEIERLNMRVDDLTDVNQKILEEQQRLQEELRLSKNSLQVLHEEKMELRATLLSQEDFVNSLKIQHEQLQKEVSRLTTTLYNKEAVIKSLEERLQNSEGAQEIYHDEAELEHVFLMLDHELQNKASLQAEETHLEGSLGSTNAKCVQLNEELTVKSHELQLMDEHLCHSKAEIKRAVLSQLEALRQENHHLLEKLQKGKSTPVTELQESYGKALNKVEAENQQLQKELAEARVRLEASSRVSQDKYESVLQHLQQQVTEIKNTEARRLEELQCKHEEEMRALQVRFDTAVQRYEEEIQKVQSSSSRMVPDTLPSQISRGTLTEASSCDPHLGSGDTSEKCDLSHEREFLSLSPLPTASIGVIATKFLEEEEVRSQHILECLDAHIEELKRESEKTVQQYTHQQ